MSQREWFAANLAMLNRYTDHIPARATFYRRHGLDEARRRNASSTRRCSTATASTLPPDYRRLRAGDVLAIGARPLDA